MKRRPEYSVLKRDGRRQWLRASKTARSIWLSAHGELGLELCTEIAGHAIRAARELDGVVIATATLASSVERVLCAVGCDTVAARYAEVGAERRHRAQLLCARGLAPMAAAGSGFGDRSVP